MRVLTNGTSTLVQMHRTDECDNAARLLDVWNKQSTHTISRHSYTLDAVGNRTQANELLPQLGPPGSGSPSLTTYGYDRLYQLATVTAPIGTTSYAYDPWAIV